MIPPPSSTTIDRATFASSVPGETAPIWVASLLGVFAAFGFAAAVITITPTLRAAPAPLHRASAPALPSAAVAPTRPPPAVSAVAPTNAPSAARASESRPARCPPMVVGFGFSSAEVGAEDVAALEGLATWLRGHPGSTVLVHGHADAFGKDDANLSLSRMRAGAVADHLVARGVGRGRLTVRGFGAYQPVEGAPEEAASNRRAVVYVRSGAECPWPVVEELP